MNALREYKTARECTNAADAMQMEADRCVKCGLCLPHCATYALTSSEAESPRGRITLLQGLAEGRIPADDTVQAALDHCLSCRACERVCPAQVRYGRLFDLGQQWLAQHDPARLHPVRRQHRWLAHAALRRPLLWLLWAAQRLRLTALLQRMLPHAGLRRALTRLPKLPAPRPLPAQHGPGTGPPVALFAGCLGDSAERSAAMAMTQLLASAGYRVDTPRRQFCCGALAQHSGDAAAARDALQRNAGVFAGDSPIVSLATGCAAWLADASAELGAPDWLQRVASPWDVLARAPRTLHFEPTRQRVALWVACTQRNVTRDQDALLELLRRVPGATVETLLTPSSCCGAAGMHFLNQAERADALGAPIVEAVRAGGYDLLLCANIGCRLHLATLMREAGITAPVLHPAEWLLAMMNDE